MPLNSWEIRAKHSKAEERGGMTRSISNVFQGSDITITPARFAQQERESGWKNPKFLEAFEVDDEDLEPGFRGALPECLKRADDEDEEFVMTLGSDE